MNLVDGHAFSVASPVHRLWNSLLCKVHSANTLPVFGSQLKTRFHDYLLKFFLLPFSLLLYNGVYHRPRGYSMPKPDHGRISPPSGSATDFSVLSDPLSPFLQLDTRPISAGTGKPESKGIPVVLAAASVWFENWGSRVQVKNRGGN